MLKIGKIKQQSIHSDFSFLSKIKNVLTWRPCHVRVILTLAPEQVLVQTSSATKRKKE